MPDAIELDLYVSPYCPRCDAMLENLAALNSVSGRPLTIRKRDVLEHLDVAVAAGVCATPVFVLDGRVLASGRVTPNRLRKILQDTLSGDSNDGTHDR
jgi:predicted DsbA family dithiol-disulfide isomerase